MATYHFQVDNDLSDRHELELPDNAAAVRECLRAAADLMVELPMERAGEEGYRVEVREAGGDTILKIEVQATRGR